LQDAKGQGTHWGYFDRYGQPRASYYVAKLVQRVIKGGYQVQITQAGALTVVHGGQDGLALVCACGDIDGVGMVAANYTVPTKWGVVASSDFILDDQHGILPAGAWMVVQWEGAR
jgi:hypothetical protein